MNTGQTLLTLGSLILFSTVSLNFNDALLKNSTVDIENKVMLSAISLADDAIEEIKSKGFDETTLPFPTNNPNTLTPNNLLGPETGEAYPNFDDIDDFNNFSKVVSEPHAENYTLSIRVNYVDNDNPNTILTTQSFTKKIAINVSSPFMRNSVNLSYIITLK